MKKAEINLPDREWQILDNLSKSEGKTIPELIKDAIEFILIKKHEDHFEISLNNIFGIWKNKKDISSTNSYIRKLRKGRRLEKFYAKSSH